MKFEILTIPPFDRQFKKLVKKFPSLKKEIVQLANSLVEEPRIGTSLGNDWYKIRIAIASKGKGKSGGARVITNVYVSEAAVYLLAIYDKSEVSTLTDTEIKDLLAYVER